MDLMTILLDSRVLGIIFGVILPYLFYKYSTRNFSYWADKGIPFVKPYPLIGSLIGGFTKNMETADQENYIKYGRIFGTYESSKPSLMVAEPHLLRDILVKDFQYFINRRDFDTGDVLTDKMMSAVQNEDWKRIRSTVSPTFSTGKIKRVLGIFKECARHTVENVKLASAKKKEVDILKLYGAFTMDIIASAAFSTKLDSHNDPENRFIKMAKKVFQPCSPIRLILLFLAPKLLKLFKMSIFDYQSMQFFKSVTLEIIKERKRTGQVRNDFLQLLLDSADEAANEELNENNPEDIVENYGDESINHSIFKNVSNKRLSSDEIVAQCLIFFLAGYHTTSVTLGIATYLLALNQNEQQKLFDELTQVLEETNGELKYESVQKMKYLDNVISETLRIYAPAVRTERQAGADYKLGDTGLIIPKGMIIGIPVYAMHRDPHFFPEPEKFNPDRFSPEQREKIIPYSYLPFGAGPRNCVGMRFALMEIKICLIHIFSKFHVKQCSETDIPIEFFQRGLGLLAPKSIIVHLEPRKNCPLKS